MVIQEKHGRYLYPLPLPLHLLQKPKSPCPHLPEQSAFHRGSSYWLNRQPWSAALTMESCSHLISFNRVKEALRGKTPPASSEAWRRATEIGRQERRRGIFEQERASIFEIIWDALRPKSQSTGQILTSAWLWGFLPEIREDHKSTHRHINMPIVAKAKWYQRNGRLAAPTDRWRSELQLEERPEGRLSSSSERSVKFTSSIHTHTHTHHSDVLPQWHLEGSSGCIILQLYFYTVWPWSAWKSWSGEEQTGLVISCKANYYLSNISHTINISLSISAHLRRGIKGAGILLTKMNAPSSLPPLWPISLEI